MTVSTARRCGTPSRRPWMLRNEIHPPARGVPVSSRSTTLRVCRHVRRPRPARSSAFESAVEPCRHEWMPRLKSATEGRRTEIDTGTGSAYIALQWAPGSAAPATAVQRTLQHGTYLNKGEAEHEPDH